MVYSPRGACIPDKVCVVAPYNRGYMQTMHVGFSAKVDDPPANTIAVIPNMIRGPLRIDRIAMSSNFYSTCNITHCLPFTDIGKAVIAQINYWALNDLVFSGVVEKDGILKDGTELVVAVYGGHSSLILKGGEVYEKIIK